jgi:small conductance mechanosensitive channel
MLYTFPPWAQQLLIIVVIWLLTWIISLFTPFLSTFLLWMFRREARTNPERKQTLAGLLTGLLRMLLLLIALMATLGLGLSVELDSLVWLIGLFAAGFGLGARPFISDILTGLTFIYDDTFDVGEKIEILDTSGVVESVGLRTTHLRAPSGELYVIPNGDIRVIRNFSRGKFSQLTIKLVISAAKIDQTMSILRRLGHDILVLVPDIIEPWFVTSEGELSETSRLTIVAKTRFGRAADTKPHLESLIKQRLLQSDITAQSAATIGSES